MASPGWQTDPNIQEAKRVAKALGKTAVIVIHVDDRDGTIGSASYGIDGPRCTEAGKWAEAAYDAVYNAIVNGTPRRSPRARSK